MNSEQKTINEYKKVLNGAIKGYLLSNCRFFLAVSGGVDSMVMSTLFIDRAKENGLRNDQITILHFDHGQRESSKSDAQFVKSAFDTYSVEIDSRKGGESSETVLRDARFLFFKNKCNEVSKGKKSILMLGHHLDDRIETTVMNMKRGCDLPGILNMRTVQDAWFNQKILIIRPLLLLSKSTIIDYARKNCIEYVQDKTNFITDYTWRNTIRSGLRISEQEYILLNNSYNSLENTFAYGLSQIVLKKLNEEYTCGNEGYELCKLTDIDNKYILWKLGFYSFSAGFLQEFTRFTSLESGIIKLNNTIFMRSLKKLYWFNTYSEFRLIDKTEQDSKYLQNGDRRQEMSARRYSMEKGVPLFARNSIKVERNQGGIVGITIPSAADIYDA